METVRRAEGIRVDGVGERHGGGREHHQQNPRAAGGFRPRTSNPYDYSANELDIHEDAVNACIDSMHCSTALCVVDQEEEEDDNDSSGVEE